MRGPRIICKRIVLRCRQEGFPGLLNQTKNSAKKFQNLSEEIIDLIQAVVKKNNKQIHINHFQRMLFFD